MGKQKTCQECGRIFTPSGTNSRYCCLYCREAASRKKRKQWEAEHPGYNTEYARMRRAAHQIGEPIGEPSE